MLGNRTIIKVNAEDESYELTLNFKSLKNLYEFTNRNVFNVFDDFLKKEDKDGYLTGLLYCFSDGKIGLETIHNLLQDKALKNNLIIGFTGLILEELYPEDYNGKKENNSGSAEEDKEKNANEFLEWWNVCYYIATIQLNKTESDFYEMTPRELGTMNIINRNYYKSILLSAYSEVVKAKADAEKQAQEEEKKRMTITDMRQLGF